METLDITLGTSLNIQLMMGKSKRRYIVQVIGLVKGQTIMVTMPRDDSGALADVFTHDDYVVRFFKGRNIIAFRSKILQVAKTPFWFLHLQYPEKLEKVEIRQSERIHISLKARALVGGKNFNAVIQDLSANGALVVINDEIGKQGDHMELFFNLKIADIERGVHVVALIRNVRGGKNQTTGKSSYQYGLEFMDTSEQDVVFVQGFVYEQLLMHREDGLEQN